MHTLFDLLMLLYSLFMTFMLGYTVHHSQVVTPDPLPVEPPVVLPVERGQNHRPLTLLLMDKQGRIKHEQTIHAAKVPSKVEYGGKTFLYLTDTPVGASYTEMGA